MNHLLIAISTILAVTEPPIASLQVNGEHSIFSVMVEASVSAGYTMRIKCISACAKPIELIEPTGDSPMGIFTRDQDGLVFSLWAGGSAYRVRVWQLSDAGVRKVVELSSRGRPDFVTDKAGRSAIRTYEANSGGDPLKPKLRSFVGGRFVLSP